MSLDSFYADLAKRSGILRIRDPRLELLAQDRALEARHTVGTEGSTGIPHPVQQLVARTWPLQGTFKGVWENAVWSYASDFVNDPWTSAADAWWDSPIHRANLERVEATHIGIGVHVEEPTGSQNNERWYVIAEFTRNLDPLTKRRLSIKQGPHFGVQLTAEGELIGSKGATLARDSGASYDLRWQVPGLGPHFHIVDGLWKNYWLPESAAVQPVPL